MVGRCQNLQGVQVQRVFPGSIGPAVAVMVLRRQVVSGIIVTWRGFMFAGSPVLHGVLLQRQRITSSEDTGSPMPWLCRSRSTAPDSSLLDAMSLSSNADGPSLDAMSSSSDTVEPLLDAIDSDLLGVAGNSEEAWGTGGDRGGVNPNDGSKAQS